MYFILEVSKHTKHAKQPKLAKLAKPLDSKKVFRQFRSDKKYLNIKTPQTTPVERDKFRCLASLGTSYRTN